ncbi:MAG TPA: apolipoprotein N-acyltransferase, partial [Bacteroidota bacterium]|nr:apolipoprotein N-acyltransferase [Bacteroidota bacterium]
ISDGSGRSTGLNVALAVVAGGLLGLSFPPSPFYSLAYVSFIPFFFLFERMKSFWQLVRYSYLYLIIFNILTLYWTGGFTHMKDPYLMTAGGLLLVFHPFFLMPGILLAWYVGKVLGRPWGLVSFIVLWVANEFIHSLSELSFPWITIGNSQAYDLFRMQIVEYTSVYGLSVLLLVFNVLAYFWIRLTTSGRWRFVSLESGLTVFALLLVYFVPWIYGRTVISKFALPDSSNKFRVGLIQPNIDPFEKWGTNGNLYPLERQLGTHLDETRSLAADSVDLVLWCETAIPFRVPAPSRLWIRSSLDSIGVPVLAGFPYQVLVDSAHASATAQRIGGSALYSEDYNSVMLLVPHTPVREIYKKIKLVPFAERIPYAETLHFLVEPLKWSVGISGWGLGRDTVLFSMQSRNGARENFAGMICYESVFPDFVRQFVLRGAQFLVILTNDSWWGNTSGAYQHMAFASLRAVENRRWVVQCANGGISGFVDPGGTIHQATTMYTSTTAWRDIEPRDGTTFYDRHGDLFAQLCLTIAVMFVAASLVRQVQSRVRKP